MTFTPTAMRGSGCRCRCLPVTYMSAQFECIPAPNTSFLLDFASPAAQLTRPSLRKCLWFGVSKGALCNVSCVDAGDSILHWCFLQTSFTSTLQQLQHVGALLQQQGVCWTKVVASMNILHQENPVNYFSWSLYWLCHSNEVVVIH